MTFYGLWISCYSVIQLHWVSIQDRSFSSVHLYLSRRKVFVVKPFEWRSNVINNLYLIKKECFGPKNNKSFLNNSFGVGNLTGALRWNNSSGWTRDYCGQAKKLRPHRRCIVGVKTEYFFYQKISLWHHQRKLLNHYIHQGDRVSQCKTST